MMRLSLSCPSARSVVVGVLLCFAATCAHAAPAGKAEAVSPEPDAGGWQARIVGSDASPSRLIAVDKKTQTLFLFERHSPLRLANQFACTTGQSEGDKFVQGDLKTPEGIYFVVSRLDSGLNFEKYGPEAYTLNYPNPVDKLRRKTGYGIWIHGRGVPIVPNLTEGCVSLNNTDLALLGKNLTPGTPVALAQRVDFSPSPTAEDKTLISMLHKRTYDWAKAWSARSGKFFEYYEPERYSQAQGESFASFRDQKERVFKSVKWIDVKIANLQALQGPGYWVTWFEQDYRASNLSAKGIRRLYWQKDTKGDLRIVGMEWAPKLSGTLTAGLNDAPGAAAEPVVAPAKPAAPKAEPAAPVPVALAEAPRPRPVLPVAVAAPDSKPPAQAKPAPLPAAPVVPAGPKIGEVTAFVEQWRSAWEKGDLKAYITCYARTAVQGGRVGSSAIESQKRALWKKSSPTHVELTNIRITPKQDMVIVDMHQSYTDSRSFADMGVKTIYLQAVDNAWRIVREDWSPM